MHTLRDWFSHAPQPADDTTSPAAPRIDPAETAEELRQQLTAQQETNSNPHARLKLLETCYHESSRALTQIESGVSRAGLPLPGDVLQAALAADNLLKTMAAGYGWLIDALRAQHVPGSASHLVKLAALRATQCLARRQELACRAYAPASANTWQQLNAIYAYARREGLTAYANGGRTLEAEYLGALLLAHADPSKFSRQNLAQLFECVAHFAPLAVVHDAGTVSAERVGAAQFLLHEGNRHPGKRLTDVAPEQRQRGWVVDCTQLVATLGSVLARRQQGMPRSEGDPATPTAILKTVLNAWRGQRQRRFARQSFKPRGELVAGFPALLAALATDTVTDGSEWTILDESPDGFGLRYLRGSAIDLQVGQLVGLRPREREKLHVCLVRRVVNGGAARLELGLQEIAPVAFALHLPGGRNGTTTPVIFFPAMPAHRGIPGALARTGTLAAGDYLAAPGQPPLRAQRVIETDEPYELWELSAQ